MKSTKIFALAISLSLGLGMLGVAGCSPSKDATPEIEQYTISQLSKVKNMDSDFVEGLMEGVSEGSGLDVLENFGIEKEELVRALFDGFDYSIDQIQQNGKKATVNLLITTKDLSGLSDMTASIQQELTAQMMSSLSQFEDMDESQITNYAVQSALGMLMDKIDALPLSEGNPLKLELTEQGGEWGMTESQQEDFANRLVEIMGL